MWYGERHIKKFVGGQIEGKRGVEGSEIEQMRGG